MSACLQPTSPGGPKLRAQGAGPITAIAGDESKSSACRTGAGRANLSEIDEGAEALFQILQTDAEDLNTVHERANRLAELEKKYAEAFAIDCAGVGPSAEKTAKRIEKLTTLARETDSSVIQAIASQLWDLFNPNLHGRDANGAIDGNPFREAETP